ncbi:PREDICTED: BAG family molecular chaperone regulator 2-like [Ipomoea nil]|uniref:BAG family molecular chaperone regulator 2-like n=1 Tax=Ipomoea nil TaxID=35883 RepID=UPI000901ED93|nr:PREDICTED: BAG family molecular chaperone regulator 2-like [Ipomoea nil]
MMKRKLKFNAGRRAGVGETTTTSSAARISEEVKWEMRPGGMLVQKRGDNSGDAVSAPKLQIRVAYDAARFDLSVNSHATFGEVKKLITAETGLQPGEQRLIFRGKERENGDYLDMSGVRERSKLILIEDPESKERRFMQMRRNAKIQTSRRLIHDVAMDVDKLSEQVCAIEKSIGNGNKVAELQITTLIEMLMAQAVKLDNVHAEGDACAHKNLQSERVKKCVESLDELKVANNAQVKPPVVVATAKWKFLDDPPPPATTNWEIFD